MNLRDYLWEIMPFREQGVELMRSRDAWMEEARRYSENADYWRGRYESLKGAVEDYLCCEDCGGTGWVVNPEGDGAEECRCKRKLNILLWGNDDAG